VSRARRPTPARPGTLAVLPREQAGAPAVACDPSPLSLDAAFGRPDQFSQGLPTDGRVPVEDPLDGPIGS
jgi:hypothetical protein